MGPKQQLFPLYTVTYAYHKVNIQQSKVSKSIREHNTFTYKFLYKVSKFWFVLSFVIQAAFAFKRSLV